MPLRLPGALWALLPLAILGAWLMAYAAHAEVQAGAEGRLAKAQRDREGARAPHLTHAERDALLAKAERRTQAADHGLREAAVLKDHLPFAVLALIPLWLGVLASFHPRTIAALRTWPPGRVAALGAALSVWVLLFTSTQFLDPARFNLYAPAIVAAAAAAAILATRGGLTPGKLCGIGLVVWLLLWIPFDLRWFKGIWLGTSTALAYSTFALLLVVLAVLSYAVVGRLDTLGLKPPRGSDLALTGIFLLLIAIVVIPLGLVTGFLEANLTKLSVGQALLVGLGLVFTVALPEELFFRGILDAGLQKHFRSPWASLAVSSLAFGLMHWNNASSLEERLLYVLLATIAGAFYGLTFRKSGGLVAPVLVHAITDLAWQALLGG